MRLLLSFALLSIAVAAKTPVTHSAIWTFKTVGAPAVSPDGKWVVCSVREPGYDEAQIASDLWIVPADGSAKPRQLTHTRAAEGGVAWSPDSTRIAFSARRDADETAQIYLLDIARGGEAARFTTLSTGASDPLWRPDGGALAFTSMVYPGTLTDEDNKKVAAERKGIKYKARVYETFPIRHWDHWLDDRQIHEFVQELKEGSVAKDVLAGSQLVTQRGFSGGLTNGGMELETAWAPDGRSLVFSATTNRTSAAFEDVTFALYQVPSTGGEPRKLTGAKRSFGSPQFSADGKALYSLFVEEGYKVYYAQRIAMFAWPAMGEPVGITASSDKTVSRMALSSDGNKIYFTAEDQGHEKVFEVASTGGAVKEAFAIDGGCYTNLTIPKAGGVFANWDSAVNPGEVVRVDARTGRRVALTDFNATQAADLDWQPVKHFWHTSKRGKRIHSMLVTPQNFDASKKYPLLVVIHGGAANMWRDAFGVRWNYHLLASPGYVVVLTNYTGSTGFGEKFSQDIQFDPLKGPAEEINEAADEAIRQFAFIDGTRQAAAGASYGGHLVNWLQASTTRYKALVAHAGEINLESQWGTSDGIYHREVNSGGPHWGDGKGETSKVWRDQNPIKYANQFRTPILLSVGERDYRVPMNQTLENWSVLQRMRVPSKLIVWEEENHWITKGEDSRYFYQEMRAWLAKYL